MSDSSIPAPLEPFKRMILSELLPGPLPLSDLCCVSKCEYYLAEDDNELPALVERVLTRARLRTTALNELLREGKVRLSLEEVVIPATDDDGLAFGECHHGRCRTLARALDQAKVWHFEDYQCGIYHMTVNQPVGSYGATQVMATIVSP